MSSDDQPVGKDYLKQLASFGPAHSDPFKAIVGSMARELLAAREVMPGLFDALPLTKATKELAQKTAAYLAKYGETGGGE